MNKWTYLLLAAIWVFFACSREEDVPASHSPSSAEGEKMKVEFSVAGPRPSPATKVLDNGGDISHMYVAVFGSSGFLKEYVEAELVDDGEDDGLYTYSVELTIGESPRTVHFMGNGPSFLPFGYDTAVLPIQLSRLNDQNQGEKAYWQQVYLEKGICALRNSSGNYIDEDGDELGSDNFSGFVPDPAMVAQLQNIPLIRNWAKIVLYTEEGSHFEPWSFAVVNYPSQGAVVPYSGATGFVTDYQDLGFNDLRDMGYPSNLPAGTIFDDSMPSAAEFEADTSKFVDGGRVAAALLSKADVIAGKDAKGHAAYLYERPIPSEKIPPTYVIVYGHYRYPPSGDDPNAEGYDPGDLEHEGDYYYKVDLMETTKLDSGEWEASYYPIYRNFKYQICITSILSMGHTTPEAAAASAGSADVSADISTSHLSDISDGVARLHLTWMNQTYQKANDQEHPVEDLKVLFCDLNADPITGENAVTAKVLPAADGGPDIITQVPGDSEHPDPYPFVGEISTGADAGWRPIRFCTAAPGKSIRSQTLRITGNHDKGRIYRDVVITVLPKQEMRVQCDNPIIHTLKGTEQSVSISIPEGLTKNMFPLEFDIEPQDHTLTPDNSKPNNNLPVVTGKSFSQDPAYEGKASYHFTRTLTWDDYKAAEPYESSDDKIWRKFTCYFKTNCNKSATTVWVQSEYFETTSAFFANYGSGKIHDAIISQPVPRKQDERLPFTFSVEPDEQGVFPELTLRIRGLINGNDISSNFYMEDVDTYIFKPSVVVNTLYFTSTNDEGDLELEISAPEYNTVVIKPYHFNKNMPDYRHGLLDGVLDPITTGSATFWSNVAYGRVQSTNNRGSAKDRGVIFGYYDDPECPNPTVRLTDLDGTLLSKSNNSALAAANPSSFPYTPTGPKDAKGDVKYHELQLKTVEGQKNNDVNLILSANGYLEERYHYTRLAGQTHIHTYFYTASNYDTTNKWIKPANKDQDKASFCMTFTPLDSAPDPVKASDGLYLGQKNGSAGDVVPGSRYEITVESGDVGIDGLDTYAKNQRFFCGFFQIDPGYEPASWTPAEGSGTCFLYSGSDRIYEWLAYDDVNEYDGGSALETNLRKTVVIEVGETPVRITRFTYKAISKFK